MQFDPTSTLPDYRDWLERVCSAYDSVTFCCFYRLHDRGLAERVGLRVVAGLVERPTIFQFSGLPFSGRIATLAERLIAEAKAGELESAGEWRAFWTELAGVPLPLQRAFVDVCVWGRDDAAVAALADGDESAARERRESMLAYFEALARHAVLPVAVGGGV